MGLGKDGNEVGEGLGKGTIEDRNRWVFAQGMNSVTNSFSTPQKMSVHKENTWYRYQIDNISVRNRFRNIVEKL